MSDQQQPKPPLPPMITREDVQVLQRRSVTIEFTAEEDGQVSAFLEGLVEWMRTVTVVRINPNIELRALR